MNVVPTTDSLTLTTSTNDLPSPLHKIISRLPSPISIKRVSISSPHSSSSKKRQKTSDGGVMSSPDMRRDVLVKQVRKKLSSGVQISLVRNNQDKDVLELDNSVEILTDTNDNDSLSLEEREIKNSKPTITPECHDDFSNKKTPADDDKVIIHDGKPVEIVSNDLSRPVNTKACKDKKIEIQWRNVKRSKRKTRFFLFSSKIEGEKDEVTVEKAADNQKVPRVINGRRPYIVVPGVDYDLEEGEGIIMDTEEDETEIRLARNEKYEMDSFVCDTGYLSEDELMETPTVDKVINKVKQQRRANNIKAKLKFEKIGEPEVLGCLWWSGRGGQKIKMKKWQAMVFTSTPIPTSFSIAIPEEEPSFPPQPSPVQPLPQPLTTTVVDLATKYHVKYLVKHLVQKAMVGVGEGPNPNQCSTPMPGKRIWNNSATSQSALLMHVAEQGDDILKSNKEVLEKYVMKYFNKFKYQ